MTGIKTEKTDNIDRLVQHFCLSKSRLNKTERDEKSTDLFLARFQKEVIETLLSKTDFQHDQKYHKDRGQRCIKLSRL